MTQPPHHAWRLEVDKIGYNCSVFCDDTQLLNVQAVDLHLCAGQLTTMDLTFVKYPPTTSPFVENPVFHQGDTVIVNGTPAKITEETLQVTGTLIASDGPLESFIKLAILDEQTAVLRKYYRDTTTGHILCKYGLTQKGEWVRIEEGAEAPEECRITPGY